MIQVEATDYDDPREGQNAKVTYSLEKNVIDESSGSPILVIHTRTGLITTALCCLDREKTQQYEIQVVATDGGGLKGECHEDSLAAYACLKYNRNACYMNETSFAWLGEAASTQLILK